MTAPPYHGAHQLFHELTLTLVALLGAYEVEPDFADHLAEEVEAIGRRYLDVGRPPQDGQPQGTLALERLLDQLEAAGAGL